jgi:hypothetical protein
MTFEREIEYRRSPAGLMLRVSSFQTLERSSFNPAGRARLRDQRIIKALLVQLSILGR